ncbi:MAG: Ig-like domain-containing protein [Ignavibacteria bacterium]|nr:Ig-like domain-containing protein [Ignavibacteria bacterium]
MKVNLGVIIKQYFFSIFGGLLFVILPFLVGCGLQASPGGGEIDKIPPVIEETYPINGTKNYSKNYIELTFSKYVDKASFRNALFVSPAIDGELEISWTNTTATVTFPGKLKANRTYTITVGTDVIDLHNSNHMASSYTLHFSTGEAIDHGVIRGQVYDSKPAGIMVGAYSTDMDTLNPAIRKPDYISQTGDSGKFAFSGIALGTYRVFAIRDQFKDFYFQSEQDEIGVPVKDCVISQKDTLASGLTFSMQKLDTIPPRLQTAVMTDKYHILLSFSKEMENRLLTAANFSIYDSTLSREIRPIAVFKGKTKEKELALAVNDSFAVANKLFVIAKNLSDKLGNKTANDYAALVPSAKPDTTAPSIVNTYPMNNGNGIDFTSPVFRVTMDDYITNSQPSFRLIDTSKKEIPVRIIRNDGASFTIRPVQKLKSFSDYKLLIPLESMRDLAGNSTDTNITISFKTVNELDFTGVYGYVKNLRDTIHARLELLAISPDTTRYSISLPASGKFAFERVLPGKYNLFLFYDLNGNGICDKGYPYPFQPAEEGRFMKETISLAPRWSVTDVEFDADTSK